MEEWRDVVGYEGKYMVSNKGEVYSLLSHIKLKRLVINGYYRVSLCYDGDIKLALVHRLVAKAFIPNPENKRCVNHLDENRLNNDVSNIEWATHKENTHWGTNIQRMIETQRNTSPFRKAVYQYDRSLVLINQFQSASEAARVLGIRADGISHAACGREKSYKGFIWSYNKLNKEDE